MQENRRKKLYNNEDSSACTCPLHPSSFPGRMRLPGFLFRLRKIKTLTQLAMGSDLVQDGGVTKQK